MKKHVLYVIILMAIQNYYGNAKLIDCQIELIDSDEKNYIYESRAVIVNWDNGRKAVIITDIPCELLDESEIVKKYFEGYRYRNES